MEILKLRSGSSEMAHKAQPRTPKGTPVSSDSSDSKPSKVPERKPSSKGATLPEKRIVKASEMQQQLGQLQEELKRAKEERSRALRELAEVKREVPSQRNEDELLPDSKKRIEVLEREAEKAKESERKMLESLIFQTKQLEQTKISLEESKLEIRSLQEGIRILEGQASRSSRNLEKHLDKKDTPDLARSEEEIGMLRNELKLAMEAEGKSKKAMDDLAIALKEVSTEANQAKGNLSSALSELENARAEAERLKSLLKISEEKFRAAVEESEQVKLELEESVAAWIAKENGFINCMKGSQEEMSKAKEENDRLIDSQRVSREDNSKLRDILKQAVNEATVVKEALEMVRKENSHLNELLSEKENALQSIKQEYECLKVSEAAALDSVRELKSLLAATSTMDSSRTSGSFEPVTARQPNAAPNVIRDRESMAKFSSDRWSNENPRIRNERRHSVGEAGKFKGSVFDAAGSQERKDRMFASVSSVTAAKVPSTLFTDDGGSVNFDDFDHIDRNQLAEMEHERGSPSKGRKKKAPMLRRFGDMLRRRSFHK